MDKLNRTQKVLYYLFGGVAAVLVVAAVLAAPAIVTELSPQAKLKFEMEAATLEGQVFCLKSKTAAIWSTEKKAEWERRMHDRGATVPLKLETGDCWVKPSMTPERGGME